MSMRGRSIVWGVCVLLVGTIGVLWAITTIDVDPEKVKAEFQTKIDELNRIPDQEAIRKDAFALELLDNENYKKYAKALWLKVERAERSLKEAAQLERAAAKEVPPFLARSKDLSKIERSELELLIGEARVHIANYGATRYGEALRKRLAELTAKLESLPKLVTPPDFMELIRKVTIAQHEGRYSDAMDLIDELLKRPGAQEYAKKIETMQESLRTKAAAAALQILQKAQGLLDRGDKTAALQVLDRSASDFRRFRKETESFDALRRKITLR